MKKSLYVTIYCALMFAVFNTSYGVTFTSQYNGDGSFDILYEGQLPSGVALDIALPDGLTTDYALCSVNSSYNFFPDWVYLSPMLWGPVEASDIIGVGNPIAYIEQPGNWTDSVSNFCVSMAAWGSPGYSSTYDLDQDFYITFQDLALFTQDWLYLDEFGGFLSPMDFNGDGTVDMRDLRMMIGQQTLDSPVSGVLMTIQTLNYDPAAVYGQIGIELNQLREGTVPEPATLSLLALGGLTLLRKRK